MRASVSAILLAAGSSKRMGQTKQLLPIGDRTVIAIAADAILKGGVSDLIVVKGANHDAIVTALNGIPARYAINPDPESVMAESVIIGLKEVSDSSSGVLVCLADHPLVSAETIQMLLELHQKSPGSIIVPVCLGKRGHPTLFPISIIRDIYSARSLREIISSNSSLTVFAEVSDEGILLDMNTMSEYMTVLAKRGQSFGNRGLSEETIH